MGELSVKEEVILKRIRAFNCLFTFIVEKELFKSTEFRSFIQDNKIIPVYGAKEIKVELSVPFNTFAGEDDQSEGQLLEGDYIPTDPYDVMDAQHGFMYNYAPSFPLTTGEIEPDKLIKYILLDIQYIYIYIYRVDKRSTLLQQNSSIMIKPHEHQSMNEERKESWVPKMAGSGGSQVDPKKAAAFQVNIEDTFYQNKNLVYLYTK